MYKDRLNEFIMLDIKVLMICWEVVFKYEVFLGFILLNKKYLVQLYSEENVLND